MNVFVLCTGRCGSKALIRACQHIENFTSAHESRIGQVGSARLDYPKDHIEADNRLAFYLGRLHFEYGGDARYVHLQRDLKATAASYAVRHREGIMNAFTSGLLVPHQMSDEAKTPLALATDICETMRSNIRHFLLDKPHSIEMHLETIQHDFRRFWQFIDAKGDLERALATFDRPTGCLVDARTRNTILNALSLCATREQ